MSKLSKIVISHQFNKFIKDDNYNLDILIKQLKNCTPLEEYKLRILCEKVIFSQ